MRLKGKKIGILIESDFYEKEIFYYEKRFPEEGAELHFLSRLWDQDSLTFYGHEYKVPFECHESFENMSDEELRSYDAIIVPSAIVSDRLRYTEDLSKLAPAVEFIQARVCRTGHPQGHHLPRHVAGLARARTGARPPGGRSPQSLWRCQEHGRYLHRSRCGRGWRSRDRTHRRSLPSLRPPDYRNAWRALKTE